MGGGKKVLKMATHLAADLSVDPPPCGIVITRMRDGGHWALCCTVRVGYKNNNNNKGDKWKVGQQSRKKPAGWQSAAAVSLSCTIILRHHVLLLLEEVRTDSLSTV